LLADLVYDADLQVAVGEQQLVKRQRAADPVVAVVITRVDVIQEVGAVHPDRCGGISV
jgi:hypothetical protein